MIGEKLGPYEILDSICFCGMEKVWKVRDTQLGRIVAIKKAKEQHSEIHCSANHLSYPRCCAE